jgi:hypothetical protein
MSSPRCVSVMTVRVGVMRRKSPLCLPDRIEHNEPAGEHVVKWDTGYTTRLVMPDALPLPTLCETRHVYSRRLAKAIRERLE